MTGNLGVILCWGILLTVAATTVLADCELHNVDHSPLASLRRLQENATAPKPSKPKLPFQSAETAIATLVHIVGFIITLLASHTLGLLFPRLLGLPLVTGYMLVGILAGPFVINLIPAEAVGMLASSVNALALAFISFQAGQEVYLPEIKPQLKGISQLVIMRFTIAVVIMTLVLYLAAGPFFYGKMDSMCQLGIALMFAAISVLVSPSTVMAIKIELGANGPFTNLMLGNTMTAEFIVLVAFSVAREWATVYCAKLDVSFVNIMFTAGIVLSNVLIGGLVAVVTVAIFLIPGGPPHHHDHDHGHGDGDDHTAVLEDASAHEDHHDHASPYGSGFGSLYFKGFIWILFGYVFYISTNVISQASVAAYGHTWDVKIEALLVLIIGSCIAGHYTKIRHDMHVILDTAAPFIFLPFFVMTGANLKLDQVVGALPLTTLYVVTRYFASFVACYTTGRFLLKLPPHQYNTLWMTMTPQAGVALGLAGEVIAMSPAPWTSQFQSTIVAGVVINQIIGPVLCAYGLRQSGECTLGAKEKADQTPHADGGANDHKPSISHDPTSDGLPDKLGFHRIRKAVVVGHDDTAVEIATQLVLYGAHVEIPLLSADRARRWKTVTLAIQNSALAHKHMTPGGRGQGGATPHDSHFVQLDSIIRGNNHDDAAIRQTLAAATAPGTAADAIFFTGDGFRTLDHIKTLAVTATPGTAQPRLVAVVQDMQVIEELKRLRVYIIQPSLGVANIAIHIGLADRHTAKKFGGDVTPSDAVSSAAMLLEPGTAAPLQRVIQDRRRLLDRNIRRIMFFQAGTHDGLRQALGLDQLPPANLAPQRVSMFGLASGSEYFWGGASMRRVRKSDIYVMGDDSDEEVVPSPGLLSSQSKVAFAHEGPTPKHYTRRGR